ncbi:glucose-6-phosphate isomerase [Arcticibacter tournemirensis]|uniref:glucose-6-phosphate isomerase n=1 Tax=Arcticibacter tournemirensis TaxID=699437 RepID=A0A5M9HE18_9SPHI|nr:glucose-6-phosphate isomerase family protein [Arcticibacter tournemirensis]KAA8483147.1 cupin domain-containing protein [Arcticibacter tournemirensis]TQM51937.1 glucose-6-phosphate isomerase [Arcticibacter tournemirensis]
MDTIINEPKRVFRDDHLGGEGVDKSIRKLKDLRGIFKDERAFENMDPETLVYEVISYLPVKEGTQGGVYFGVTSIFPGSVGGEYFMTKGHFHAMIDRTEFYWGIKGEGVLILMDEQRRVWAEKMFPGSFHYIPGRVAHRVANTGKELLSFAASWPSDAGHNYEEIARNGFAKRLIDINGVASLI